MASNQAMNALGHAVSGSVGTAISTAALYPLDLVTTRLKAQPPSPSQSQAPSQPLSQPPSQPQDTDACYDGVIAAFRGITSREGGIQALYSGLGADVAKSMVDSFLFFGFYNYLCRRGRKPRILEELAVGAIAGACSRAITTPMSNVVTRKQMSSGQQTLGEMLAAIHKQSGLLGLWSGYSATLVLTLNPSITFFVNRRLAKRIIPALEDEDIPVAWVAFLIAAWSKATATAMTYPFQKGKTRLQMASCSRDAPTPDEDKGVESKQAPVSLHSKVARLLDQTIFGVILRIVKEEGTQALYAGIQGELLKSFFSHGLTMLSKGLIHRLIIRLWFLILPHLPRRRLQSKR